MLRRSQAMLIVVGLAVSSVVAAEERQFEKGSLIIPMDLAYQDSGMFQAYGLLFQLLRQKIPVYWVISDSKTWHKEPCDKVGDLCDWDCAEEGSDVKCPYPTASPDFFVGASVVWDGEGKATAGDTITNHGYRGGPFVIDSADRESALPIINAWNDKTLWKDNAWAERSVVAVVSVHEATAGFKGFVRKTMLAAPTIAVFSDGNEDIATSYLRAAGIPQSNGSEFPDGKCGESDCGPNTANPDMLTVPSIMGDMGTCDAVNLDHKNGALFTAEGLPAFCQIMSMHWGVKDRETVQCDDRDCPATQAECSGQKITYHGHEVVAEVREFLNYPVHFFAECQAVNAYENTVPNPDWPYLDDEGRRGHFLTTTGSPPACPCSDGDFECVTGGCDGKDCCLPSNDKEKGAGFMIAQQPNAATLQILHPEVPYNQLDGPFDTVGGSEPAYNLSSFLGTKYKNDRDVTFVTGPAGPGDQDIWMTGFVDGECDILVADVEFDLTKGECNTGKVSYLGGHKYSTDTPISNNANSQGTRLFLNALFEADCVTSVGQPNITLAADGELQIATMKLPIEASYLLRYVNNGRGHALEAAMTQSVPAKLELVSATDGTQQGDTVSWDIGAIGGKPPLTGDPPSSGSRELTLRFSEYGEYELELQLGYRVGTTELAAAPYKFTILVVEGTDGPGGDAGGDGGGDGAEAGGDDGCGCEVTNSGLGCWVFILVAIALLRRRSPKRRNNTQ